MAATDVGVEDTRLMRNGGGRAKPSLLSSFQGRGVGVGKGAIPSLGGSRARHRSHRAIKIRAPLADCGKLSTFKR